MMLQCGRAVILFTSCFALPLFADCFSSVNTASEGRLRQVTDELERLYPCATFSQRAKAGQSYQPAPGCTYGEFTEFPQGIRFFYQVVDTCRGLAVESRQDDLVFIDLGSGAGRALLSAARLWKWKHCVGVEISPQLHELALEALERFETIISEDAASAISLYCTAFEDDTAQELLSGSTFRGKDQSIVAFTYSTAFPTDDNGALSWLAPSLSCLPRGSIVVTIDHPLFAHPETTSLAQVLSKNNAGQGTASFKLRCTLKGASCYGADGLDAEAFIYEKV